MRRALFAKVFLLAALTACRRGGDTPPLADTTQTVASPDEISFPADSVGRNDVLVTPELRGDTSWWAAAESDRARRHPGARPAAVPPAIVVPDTETLADITPRRVNARPSYPVLGGDGPAVLRAQILLDRAGFSPGAMDGAWGANTSKAAYWYQEVNDIPVTGFVDARTFNHLLRRDRGRPAVARYTLTPEDVAGPFVKLPPTAYEQAELECLCYESVWEKLGERFHSTGALLARLNPGVDTASVAAGMQLWVPDVERPSAAPRQQVAHLSTQPDGERGPAAEPAPADTGRAIAEPRVARIVVSKKGSYLHALDAAGRVLMHFPNTLGSAYDPSPTGEYHVTRVAFDPDFHYNPKLYADVPDTRADAHLPPGPNSPVGVVWMALSKPHYGIHGTSSPSKIGYADSHGCVRLTNWDARWLAEHTTEGTPVEFR